MNEDEELLSLLERIAGRDEGALHRLHLKVSRRVFSFISRSVRDHARAEEVLQDTMYAVWTDAGRFSGKSKVLTWILGIAKNKALMVLRKHARPGMEPVELEVEELERRLGSEGPDPLKLLEEQRDREYLEHCVNALRDIHSECLDLVYFQELPLADVAEVLRIPKGTVQSRLYHARLKVEDCLRKLFGTLNPAGGAT